MKISVCILHKKHALVEKDFSRLKCHNFQICLFYQYMNILESKIKSNGNKFSDVPEIRSKRLIIALNYKLPIHYSKMKVWFQNCRAKWKKQRKRSSMLHSPTSLFPSHSLSPLMPSFSPGWGSSGYSGGCSVFN